MPRLTVLYSPLCPACSYLARWRMAYDYGYEVDEISIADVAGGRRTVPDEVARVIEEMRQQGGFLFAPMVVFEDGRAMAFWKLPAFLREAHA